MNTEINNKEMEARKNNAGFSLIELSVALIIIAFAIAGVVISFGETSNKTKTNAIVTDLFAVKDSVATLYSGRSNYTGLTNNILISSDSLPDNMVNGTSNLINTYKGQITAIPADNLGTDDSFSITFTNIPVEACVAISAYPFSNDLVSLTINGTNYTDRPSPANIVTNCNSSSPTTLIWQFLG